MVNGKFLPLNAYFYCFEMLIWAFWQKQVFFFRSIKRVCGERFAELAKSIGI